MVMPVQDMRKIQVLSPLKLTSSAQRSNPKQGLALIAISRLQLGVLVIVSTIVGCGKSSRSDCSEHVGSAAS